MSHKPAGWIILLLAAVVATTPLAIDMYLPAMPIMAQQLDTSIGMVQQSLSIFLAFFGISMLVCGPLADSLGRRPLAIFGLSGFVLASIALSLVSSIEWFLAWRAVQALCGAAATVVVPGIVRHIYQEHTAKGMSYVSMIMMLAPLLAPAIGSGVLWLANWQMIFVTLAGYGAVVLLLSWRYLPEIRTSAQQVKPTFLSGYKVVFSRVSARPDIATSMFASFSFFCFLTAVPFVYIKFFGVNEQQFSLLFGFNVAMLMLANFVNSKVVTRLGPQRMLRVGLVLAMISASALALFNFWQLSLVYTVVSIAPLMASLSLIATNADAMILMKFPDNSGTATAVIGTLRFGIGALAGPLLAFFYNGTALPFSLLMLLGVLCIAVSQLWHKPTEQSTAN
ncbi:multidrug effflux MFS transporter [Rheinheimera baltica]|uniref:Bcr/CflA family efflux transporter n=1 Tax=Rheinheimera baltica TaxID=67576 RepID=A0ABT9I144_9GAMM|nr:multidrug effflux MFS transporter [Rheinheimera baltica]MDP5137102.1 multidrug effflux MFS transporter [Rheinheimera baltica]MDP5142421.1 multidrug effflux MFS transporter [Rheinheimera baltica]MDP5150676.1 multidrug effflux MFS transporter [Rheinheimera baltica]MDP5189292.1 multidrug effflux MFS transporter [Rheinheimera baltica]